MYKLKLALLVMLWGGTLVADTVLTEGKYEVTSEMAMKQMEDPSVANDAAKRAIHRYDSFFGLSYVCLALLSTYVGYDSWKKWKDSGNDEEN